MQFEEKQREPLPLTIPELEIVVLALESYYKRVLRKTERLAKNYGDEKGRSVKDSQALARIQECLQYVTIIRNIRTNKLNPDVALSGGLTIDEEKTASGSGEPESNGGKES